jgi:hypothetical protein
LHRWEFVHALSGGREHWRWRWRRKDARSIIGESSAFPLFLECMADARRHGFDLTWDEFELMEE